MSQPLSSARFNGRGEAWRSGDADLRVWIPPPSAETGFRRVGCRLASINRDRYRGVRARARSMFESNFPVDGASCDYATLWNALKRIAAGASTDEQTQLFKATAPRIYRLD